MSIGNGDDDEVQIRVNCIKNAKRYTSTKKRNIKI